MKTTDNSENLGKIAALFAIILYQQYPEPEESATHKPTTTIFITDHQSEPEI